MGYPYINKEYQQTRYNVTKCRDRRVTGSVKYVVIHYTGTDASAKNNCIYLNLWNCFKQPVQVRAEEVFAASSEETSALKNDIDELQEDVKRFTV